MRRGRRQDLALTFAYGNEFIINPEEEKGRLHWYIVKGRQTITERAFGVW